MAITSSNINDSVGAKTVFENIVEAKYDEPNLQHLFADSGYRGKLKERVKKDLKMSLTIVKKMDNMKDWAIQPKRWIVERTFAWLLHFKRLVINYKRTEESAISYIYVAMMCLMVTNIN